MSDPKRPAQTEQQVFEAWYATKQRQTMARSHMGWARLGYQAHDEKIRALEDEILLWQLASGLIGVDGDLKYATPKALREMLKVFGP